MEGNIYRVTYSFIRHAATLHMSDGSVREIPLDEDEWEEALKGDVIANISRIADGKVYNNGTGGLGEGLAGQEDGGTRIQENEAVYDKGEEEQRER